MTQYKPIFTLLRGSTVESTIFGGIAVADANGKLIASYGDPETVTFLRSAAKPFQTLPLVELGGLNRFKITPQQLAVTCASHSGTDQHLRVIRSLQNAIGIEESALQCGTHAPFHQGTRRALRDRGLEPTPNHHNCSGKHTGMLGQTILLKADLRTYFDPDHPVQKKILEVIAEFCMMQTNEIHVGIDGCSVPTFAVPLQNAAAGWARLMDPNSVTASRGQAAETVISAMSSHPFMVAGPGRLDTRLMEATKGRIVAKGGAEAFQSLGIRKGAMGSGSPALGIAIKISDGDPGKRVKDRIVIETLKQLDLLTDAELENLKEFKPEYTIKNQRDIPVGQGIPCFKLKTLP
jgi:L-asparaginase II